MALDPDKLDLARLFPAPASYASRDAWRAAGFDVIDREEDDEIMVGEHRDAPGFMFKKFTRKISPAAQLENYQLRVDGSAALRTFIAERKLNRIVVPQKWIRELPTAPGNHVLVVEKIALLTKRESKRAYASSVDASTLRDLCVVVKAFRGLDSGVRNMPLTPDGKAAFIDTERWQEHDRRRKERLLRSIDDLLPKDRRAVLRKIVKQVERKNPT